MKNMLGIMHYLKVSVLGEESCIPPVITYESKEQLLVSISMLASIVYR